MILCTNQLRKVIGINLPLSMLVLLYSSGLNDGSPTSLFSGLDLAFSFLWPSELQTHPYPTLSGHLAALVVFSRVRFETQYLSDISLRLSSGLRSHH